MAATPVACGNATATQAGASITASKVGEPAAWYLAPGQNLQSSSRTFTALVSRVDCNNGITGEVLTPEVRSTGAKVIVAFTVAAKQAEYGLCQGNNKVPYQVDLGEPWDDRTLVDGLCLTADKALARSIFCASGATRLEP
ncbi:hypothetical protein [Actinoplanes friuliensis]|uniref:hypothetical protein n=1 Tax=Actinoplanes friuliensis TaxID=196914 RepID=UPI0011DDCDE6|nr:hypothetical protein [Actinoplanes friuliensis]